MHRPGRLPKLLFSAAALVLLALAIPAWCAELGGLAGSTPAARSLAFFANQPGDYDYGHQLVLPPDFGSGELTLELWIRLDESFPIGSTASGSDQLTNWSDADEEPYSSCCWWFAGNFLLDGHNNANFTDGTFSLQLYGGGRLRWLLGDGVSAGPGGHWSIGAYPATSTPSLLDGQWHRVNLVRRWSGATDALLELWIDGALVATETSPTRIDLRFWWDAWSGFPSGQEGWFWGAEKQAAIGVLSQYEDHKGLIDEVRFFNRALTPGELATGGCFASPGPIGFYTIEEGTGSSTCDALAPSSCMTLIDMKPGFWSRASPPPCTAIFVDGFESGNISQWSTSVP